MGPEVGLIVVNALLLAAGLGLLAALGILPRSVLGVLAALGLAYLTGVAAVMLPGIALLVLGVPFGLAAFAILSGALAVGGGVLAWRRGFGMPRLGAHGGLPRTLDGWVLAIFVPLFGLLAVLGLLRSSVQPLFMWDGWSIWTRKAVVLAQFDGLRPGFFDAAAYRFMHADYPLLLPLLEAVQFRAMGEIDTQAIHVVFWLLLVAFAWAIAFLAHRVTRPVIWAPIVLAAALAPGVWGQLLTAYADVPMGIFLAVGLLLVGLWLAGGRTPDLLLGTLFLAAAASIKNEGLIASFAALAMAAAVVGADRRFAALGRLAAAAAGLLVAILPWRIWVAAHGIESDIAFGKLSPGFLAERVGRIGPSAEVIVVQLADQGRWLYVVPIACALALLCILRRTGGRIAAFYLGTGALFFAFLVFAYWVSPYDLGWHLGTSVQRVVTGVVFVAFAALAQLGGQLDARPPPRPRGA